MRLNKKALNDFKEIYEKDYGIILNDEEAQILANALFNQMTVVYRPIPKNLSNLK